jgi:hypothetical protein
MQAHAETAYQYTMRRAAQAAGGVEELAAALGTEPSVVASWIAGDACPPYETFISALALANQASGAARRSPSE